MGTKKQSNITRGILLILRCIVLFLMDSNERFLQVCQQREESLSNKIANLMTEIIRDLDETIRTFLRSTIAKTELIDGYIKDDFFIIKEALEDDSKRDIKDYREQRRSKVNTNKRNPYVESELLRKHFKSSIRMKDEDLNYPEDMIPDATGAVDDTLFDQAAFNEYDGGYSSKKEIAPE